MRVGFRHGDRRFPFFWECEDQPPARWHGAGEGPVQYVMDSVDGAWAEFLRQEEIWDPVDLAGIARRIWVVELPEDIDDAARPRLDDSELFGGPSSYPTCQEEARRLRSEGARAIVAPSAALLPGCARGQLTDSGLREAPDADGLVWVLLGPHRGLRGWAAVDAGAPTERALSLVRHFGNVPGAGTEKRRSARRSGIERRQTIDLNFDPRHDRRAPGQPDRRSGRDRRAGGQPGPGAGIQAG
jgi:hypothetical protein